MELLSTTNEITKVKLHPVLMGSDFIMLEQLAKQDCGIVLLPDSISHDALISGELVRVMPDWHAPHGIFHMVYPSKQGILPAVKVLIDFLVEHLTESSHLTQH